MPKSGEHNRHPGFPSVARLAAVAKYKRDKAYHLAWRRVLSAEERLHKFCLAGDAPMAAYTFTRLQFWRKRYDTASPPSNYVAVSRLRDLASECRFFRDPKAGRAAKELNAIADLCRKGTFAEWSPDRGLEFLKLLESLRALLDRRRGPRERPYLHGKFPRPPAVGPYNPKFAEVAVRAPDAVERRQAEAQKRATDKWGITFAYTGLLLADEQREHKAERERRFKAIDGVNLLRKYFLQARSEDFEQDLVSWYLDR
jgi:hypothetical protein